VAVMLTCVHTTPTKAKLALSFEFTRKLFNDPFPLPVSMAIPVAWREWVLSPHRNMSGRWV
jgi:hypothetical protein